MFVEQMKNLKLQDEYRERGKVREKERNKEGKGEMAEKEGEEGGEGRKKELGKKRREREKGQKYMTELNF